ncbi:MAG: DNA alkylation repair protein [Candidatus Woesearchaeota archaeon]
MEIINELNEYKNENKNYQKFFKKEYTTTIFLGISVPTQRKIAKKYKELSFKQIQKLLKSKYHEYRLTAIFILLQKYKKNPKKTYEFYLENINCINNWDLVDSSAYKIIGKYLEKNSRKILYELAKKDLWQKRIAIVATLHFIKHKDYEDTLKIAKLYLKEEHDLLHKATGWMLREIGKQNKQVLDQFLEKQKRKMPRTMLRYAIEKHTKKQKQIFLQR